MQIANRESFAAARSRMVEVEYLESTGTQYVDTGFVATSNSNVEVEFALASIKSGSIFGARRRLGVSTFGARIMPYQSVPRYRWDYGSTDVYLTSVDVTVGRHTLATSGNKITYDSSVSATVPSAFSPSGLNIVIFALNENGSINTYSNGLRVCRFSILDAGVLVRDFIPVRVGRVGYLYDRVSGQLFGNAGTGDFVIGPDKTPWVNPYATDGLVAMWDGQWNAGGGVHDAAAATWTDLVGGAGLTLPSGWSVGATYVASGGNALALPDSVKTSLTIEAVFRLDSMGSGRSLIYFKNGADAGWRAATEHGISVHSNGQLNFVGAGAYTTGIAASTIYSAAVTYSSATSAASFAYINGSARSLSGSGMYGLGTASQNSGISVFPSYKFLGRMYALRFHSRALTAAEVAANYAIDKERFGLP